MSFVARYLWLSRFGFAVPRLRLGEEPFRRMLESFGSVSGIQEGRGNGDSAFLPWKNTISKIFPPRAPSRSPRQGTKTRGAAANLHESFVIKTLLQA
jgi:hypothetical protein